MVNPTNRVDGFVLQIATFILLIVRNSESHAELTGFVLQVNTYLANTLLSLFLGAPASLVPTIVHQIPGVDVNLLDSLTFGIVEPVEPFPYIRGDALDDIMRTMELLMRGIVNISRSQDVHESKLLEDLERAHRILHAVYRQHGSIACLKAMLVFARTW